MPLLKHVSTIALKLLGIDSILWFVVVQMFNSNHVAEYD